MYHQYREGYIEVICGCMFAGKTEELIRRLKRAQIAKLNVEIFKPRTDTRYDETAVVSHDLNSIQSTVMFQLLHNLHVNILCFKKSFKL